MGCGSSATTVSVASNKSAPLPQVAAYSARKRLPRREDGGGTSGGVSPLVRSHTEPPRNSASTTLAPVRVFSFGGNRNPSASASKGNEPRPCGAPHNVDWQRPPRLHMSVLPGAVHSFSSTSGTSQPAVTAQPSGAGLVHLLPIPTDKGDDVNAAFTVPSALPGSGSATGCLPPASSSSSSNSSSSSSSSGHFITTKPQRASTFQASQFDTPPRVSRLRSPKSISNRRLSPKQLDLISSSLVAAAAVHDDNLLSSTQRPHVTQQRVDSHAHK